MKRLFSYFTFPAKTQEKSHSNPPEIQRSKSQHFNDSYKPIGLIAEDFFIDAPPKINFKAIKNTDHLKSVLNGKIHIKIRAKIWRILSKYAPIEPEKELLALEKKREEYEYLISQNPIQKFEQQADTPSLEMHKLIKKDVDRTLTEWKVFKNKQVQICMHRILFIYSLRSVKNKPNFRI